MTQVKVVVNSFAARAGKSNCRTLSGKRDLTKHVYFPPDLVEACLQKAMLYVSVVCGASFVNFLKILDFDL